VKRNDSKFLFDGGKTVNIIRTNSFKYPYGLPITTLLFVTLNLLLLAGPASGGNVTCIDARARGIEIAKDGRRVVADACRGPQRIERSDATNGPGDPVTISGSVTHQNGVRMSGITLTLIDHDAGTTRTVVTDENGAYVFADITWGARVELTPSREGYEFYPPAVFWEGIVEDAIQNFIAVGPPPPPPTPPANQPTLAWSSYFDNTAQSGDGDAVIGRDAEGNTYVGGTSGAAGDQTDIVLFKTDVNGNRVWARTFDGTAHYNDGLSDMAVDAAGNTYLAGYSYTMADPLASYDFVVLKYDRNGDLQWTSFYGANSGYDDRPMSLKIDGSGNVYVAGYSWGVGTYANYATVKFDSAGQQIWAKRFAGGNGEIPNEVEVDASGNVYVTGYSNNSSAGGSEDIVTIKYNSEGTQMWFNRFDSPTQASDEGYLLEVNSAGDVFVLGETYDFETSTTFIQKIDGTTGEAAWTRPVTGFDAGRYLTATGMKLDTDGNFILTGMLSENVSYNVDAWVAKFDPETTALWSHTYDGPADEDYDGDPKIALDAQNNVYLAITSEGFANAIHFSAAT